MNSSLERWTREERRQALNAFFEADEARRLLDVFSRDCTAEDNRAFLRDAECRFRCDDEEARHWWDSLLALVNDAKCLALAEPLAQYGISVDELYECLPDDFEPLALRRAIDLAIGDQLGRRRGLAVHRFTNAAGQSIQEIRSRLEEVKERLEFQRATSTARQWWEAFESSDESDQRLELVLRLAEELANRKVTINDFHDAYAHSNTENIQATLYYLDYLSLRTKAAQAPAEMRAGTLGLTNADVGWWKKPSPGMTRVRGWTNEQISRRLKNVKAQIGWNYASSEIRTWWETLEQENRDGPALALRLAEELAYRNVTITEFDHSLRLSQTNNIRANLFYLDYLHLTTEKYQVETVTLDKYGQIVKSGQCEARCYIEELAPGVTLEMVKIPGGTFLMGSPESEGGRLNGESPQHEVTLSSFYMGKFTVTQAQWNVVAGWEKVERDLAPDPSRFISSDCPVETISWEEAMEFCTRLSRRTGHMYRLPTEAQWEYACRAGTTTPFGFGETITPEIVNYNGRHPYAKALKGKNREETIQVGHLGVANTFGLFDMHGNVWEWCSDWHDNTYYQECQMQGTVIDPHGSPTGSGRVLRGGSWHDLAVHCQSATRYATLPDARYGYVGFRLVRISR